MVGFGRLMVLLAVMAAIGYWVLRLFLTSRKRDALEAAWSAGAGDATDLDAYVRAGMEEWEHSLPRRMLWLVMLVPYTVVGALIWFVN